MQASQTRLSFPNERLDFATWPEVRIRQVEHEQKSSLHCACYAVGFGPANHDDITYDSIVTAAERGPFPKGNACLSSASLVPTGNTALYLTPTGTGMRLYRTFCRYRAMAAILSLPILATLYSHSATLYSHSQEPQWTTPFEQSDGWETTDYHSAIAYYQQLAKASEQVTMHTMGKSDSGFPLSLVLVTDNHHVALSDVASDTRTVLLINNAIHPGESDGVDASMAFARDLVFNPEQYQPLLNDVIVAIIPLYNIGGALNRNTGTRANQNGPREYGFRGNGRNYDLNRDFMKCDTRNAKAFAEIFHLLDPDFFIDTHVSNGADYQHVMTTSQSQKDKLGFNLGKYLHTDFEPKLFAAMKRAGYPTIPYVNAGGSPPDNGFSQFLETPRYSTGFTGLFQTIGYMTETHMLKPYPQRVAATRVFFDQTLKLLASEGQKLQSIRQRDRKLYHQQESVPIAWEVDRNQMTRLEFHGYEARTVESKITGGKRLLYDRDAPYVRNIPYLNHYKVRESVTLPAAYLIPREWHTVIELLELNAVEMRVLTAQVNLPAEVYRIEAVESRSAPYEGHFFHDQVDLVKVRENVVLRPGDVVVPIQQNKARYVVEALEPKAMDSLFRWNRFDTILQRKEYFSPYVFEATAEKLLAKDATLRKQFNSKKENEPDFAADRRAQLEFLYKRSNNYEKAHRRYPVVRLLALPK